MNKHKNRHYKHAAHANKMQKIYAQYKTPHIP